MHGPEKRQRPLFGSRDRPSYVQRQSKRRLGFEREPGEEQKQSHVQRDGGSLLAGQQGMTSPFVTFRRLCMWQPLQLRKQGRIWNGSEEGQLRRVRRSSLQTLVRQQAQLR